MGMVVKTISFGINGIDGYLVEVEASSTRGMPKFDLVGLPDASVKESRDRVTSAMKNCGLQICSSHLTFNLAPADIRKEGPIYDLPITVCLMLLSGHIMKNTGDCGFIGELSLSGELRSVNGVLPMVIKARETGLKRVVVPPQNAKEAAVVDGIDVYTVRDIVELKRFLNGEKDLQPVKPEPKNESDTARFVPDFSQVKGQ